VRGFPRAFTKAVRDVVADPDGSIRYVKERDALIDEALEKRRLRLAIDSVIATPNAKANGIGGVAPARPALAGRGVGGEGRVAPLAPR